MEQLRFRARRLNGSDPLLIYEERDVRNIGPPEAGRLLIEMPSGMMHCEEQKKDLQQAFKDGVPIPIPGVEVISDYGLLYPDDYVRPKGYVQYDSYIMQKEYQSYDLDSEDECLVKKMNIAPEEFEELVTVFEDNSTMNPLTLQEAMNFFENKLSAFNLSMIYNYWLRKRIRTQSPLVVKLRNQESLKSPYAVFRNRQLKRKTRHSSGKTEGSYVKMNLLRAHIKRLMVLLNCIKEREALKRETLLLKMQIFEKRYLAGDFDGEFSGVTNKSFVGQNEVVNRGVKRPMQTWTSDDDNSFDETGNEDNNTYDFSFEPHKKQRKVAIKKFKTLNQDSTQVDMDYAPKVSRQKRTYVRKIKTSEDQGLGKEMPDAEEDYFAFRRKEGCKYLQPTSFFTYGGGSDEEETMTGKWGVARRMSRGGRVVLDRIWVRTGFHVVDEVPNVGDGIVIPKDGSLVVDVEEVGEISNVFQSQIDLNLLP